MLAREIVKLGNYTIVLKPLAIRDCGTKEEARKRKGELALWSTKSKSAQDHLYLGNLGGWGARRPTKGNSQDGRREDGKM